MAAVKSLYVRTHIYTFLCSQDAWWMGLVLKHSVEFDFEVVDAVQEDPKEHRQEDW